MPMKIIRALTLAMVLGLARSTHADFVQTYSTGFLNGGVVPDGNLNGWSDTRSVNTGPGAITDVSVTLNVSGGWNGDLYAYLVHDTGFAVLLNRVGRGSGSSSGYGDAGMGIVLNDAGSLGDIHWYGGGSGPTGSYMPDGRNISPLSSGALFSSSSPTALLSSFDGLNPNGDWTLFIADASVGDQSTVTSWGLEIAAVPEPASLIEGSVAVLFLGGMIGLYRRKQRTGGAQSC
jgi:subtilisin-like proprotein convertase family protein